jgi:hypothetical protein
MTAYLPPISWCRIFQVGPPCGRLCEDCQATVNAMTPQQRRALVRSSAPVPDRHRHWFALHRHPDWHGHCRGPWYREYAFTAVHSCRRLHFHWPFTHRHTETDR